MRPRPVALVTGASSGIGRQFAMQLAAQGHDLVLVARDAERLAGLATLIAARHVVDVDVLAADLTDAADLAAVEQRIRSGTPIDVVVNSAGSGTAGRFAELDPEAELDQVRLNVLAVVALSHAAISTMVPRGAGGLLNVSSVAGFWPGPGLATYGATKAFVTSFTQAIHDETAGTGVRVVALCPGFTRTEFHERGEIDVSHIRSVAWSDPATVARAGLDALRRNKVLCVPGTVNIARVTASKMLPRRATRAITRWAVRRS
jgi:short-subunit dehydrogenase